MVQHATTLGDRDAFRKYIQKKRADYLAQPDELLKITWKFTKDITENRLITLLPLYYVIRPSETALVNYFKLEREQAGACANSGFEESMKFVENHLNADPSELRFWTNSKSNYDTPWLSSGTYKLGSTKGEIDLRTKSRNAIQEYINNLTQKAKNPEKMAEILKNLINHQTSDPKNSKIKIDNPFRALWNNITDPFIFNSDESPSKYNFWVPPKKLVLAQTEEGDDGTVLFATNTSRRSISTHKPYRNYGASVDSDNDVTVYPASYYTGNTPKFRSDWMPPELCPHVVCFNLAFFGKRSSKGKKIKSLDDIYLVEQFFQKDQVRGGASVLPISRKYSHLPEFYKGYSKTIGLLPYFRIEVGKNNSLRTAR